MTEAVTLATNRWAGVDAVAWAGAAIGLLAREPGVLLLAAVGVAFGAYARFGSTPEPAISVTREVDEPAPEPGEPVEVTLSVENRGEAFLPDVRLVDGVPTDLAVVDGSARLGTVLRAGESRTHTYAVRAERGTHEFDAAAGVCRSLNGAREIDIRSDAETVITCRPAVSGEGTPPIRQFVSHPGGQVPTEHGGSGVEFYGVREYRPGDRPARIDWGRRARTGDLATLDFREERQATVVLLVDARDAAYVRATEDAATHAVEWSVRAAASAYDALVADTNRVGIATVGAEFLWLGPGSGDAHRRRVADALSTHPALSPSPSRDRVFPRDLSPSREPDARSVEQLRRLETRLPPDAQVLVLSPLADDAAVRIGRRIQAVGNPVTVISPDVTATATPGGRVARLDRRRRVRQLQRDAVRVVDWNVDEPLAAAFERTREARP